MQKDGYDTFSAHYGLINSRGNISAFSQDSSFSLIAALEVLDDEGQLERKADMFYKGIAERSGVIKENLEAVLADEEKIKNNRKENRSYEQRR
mgnify:CR=1 FL=1